MIVVMVIQMIPGVTTVMIVTKRDSEYLVREQ